MRQTQGESYPCLHHVKKRTTYHHGDLRNALIQAALELIAAHGVEGFTLRDCAKQAGVSVAAPYRHFDDKDDLLAAVAADCIQRLGEAMDRAVEAAGDADPLTVFRATGIAYVRFAVEHPAHFRVMYLPQVMARMPKDVESAFAAWGQEMMAKLAAAQQEGVLADLPLQLIMLACSLPPVGQDHWTLDLLADRMVKLNYVPALSGDTVGRVLKKTRSSPG